jgi:hypothetical protein
MSEASGTLGDEEAHRVSAKARRGADPALTSERQRNQDYKKKYGITLDEYEAMLAAQGGVCKLCGRPPKTRRLAVDHDHKNGRVRGLLCYRCNRAIPNYVTADWLRRAADYIEPLEGVELGDHEENPLGGHLPGDPKVPGDLQA